ncbi:hypothetical protein Tco_0384443, partial [Tanacetum coccineum]
MNEKGIDSSKKEMVKEESKAEVKEENKEEEVINLKGKHFSGKITLLFASMLVQPTEDEGAPSERPSEAQPIPSPPHPSEATVDPQSDP